MSKKVKRNKSEHPNQTKTPTVITYRLIKEFKREKMNETDKYGNWISWRVEQWTRQDKPTVAKRHVYIRMDGHETTYKCLGWNLDDLAWLKENWIEINQLISEG